MNEQKEGVNMYFRTPKQTAEEWGITERRVQDMCKACKIVGAVRHGREWLIPEIAVKPPDGRKQ